jgi:hypothetical protein
MVWRLPFARALTRPHYYVFRIRRAPQRIGYRVLSGARISSQPVTGMDGGEFLPLQGAGPLI